MNLPNKLTVLRMCMIPFFVIFLLGEQAGWSWYTALFGGILEYSKWIALAFFVIASLTDLLDGKIARKYNLVTNFGKFMDPLADKLLVCSALICFVELGLLPAWMVILIVSREFIISGFRLVASDNGIVLAANYWGKFKTTSQMILTILLIADIKHPVFQALIQVFIWLSLALTIISLINYVMTNKGVLKEQK